MKIPKRIKPLVEDGLIDEVLRPLMSGKEADVFIVRCGKEIRCAKIYKEAHKRSFKQAVQYQEGRKVRNSRRARAMEKGSKFGRKQQEDVWQNAEVDALYRLASAGVRVPQRTMNTSASFPLMSGRSTSSIRPSSTKGLIRFGIFIASLYLT